MFVWLIVLIDECCLIVQNDSCLVSCWRMFSCWTKHWHLRLANETAVILITVFLPSLFTKLLFRVFSSVKNISISDICDTMWTRGGGRSQETEEAPDGCGSQQRRRSPAHGWRCWKGSPLPQWKLGVSPWETFEIANAKSCILLHFQPCPLWSMPMDGIKPCALWG